MRLWLSRNSEVPVREQLAAQIILGIISHDLKPRQKLPSTRELAHRLSIHANTVSAAYRDLARRGWVEQRRGSGVYVRALTVDSLKDEKLDVEQLISAFVQIARTRGFALSEIRSRLKRWLDQAPPDHFLVIDPDPELCKILAAEIQRATGLKVTVASPGDCSRELFAGAAPVALYGRIEEPDSMVALSASWLLLQFRSIQGALRGETRPSDDALVTVVSRCEAFLDWSRTVLIAAGIDPDALSFRDAREPGWQEGLSGSSLVISDTLTAKHAPRGCKVRAFPIIADSSIEDLIRYKEFLTRQVE
ncbi:MAG TPA: GntR family transcriptional regulator [Blastocatellia bacterium]|nr:GntR family transcriptional regulator [Blastocatellia bacterium]